MTMKVPPGIQNSGNNICFANSSVLQCLFNQQFFRLVLFDGLIVLCVKIANKVSRYALDETKYT